MHTYPLLLHVLFPLICLSKDALFDDPSPLGTVGYRAPSADLQPRKLEIDLI